jgi:hypothetical protein
MHAGLALYLPPCIQEKLLFRNRLSRYQKKAIANELVSPGLPCHMTHRPLVTPESAV